MAGNRQAKQTILQLGLVALLHHVNIDCAARFRAFDVEMHSEMCSSKLIDIHRMRQGSCSRPFASCWLTMCLDLAGWSEELATLWIGFDAIDSSVELSSLRIGSEEFLVEKVGNAQLASSVSQISTT